MSRAGIDYERLYDYRFRAVPQAERESVWRPIARYIHGQMGHPTKMLDPAAGRCEFIGAVPAEERWAVDMAVHRDLGPDSGFRMLVGDVMEVELPAEHFDGVFVSNFLEHLPSQDAVASFLKRMHGVMRPGGRIAVMGPNYPFCAKTYWDFADHLIPLSDRSVQEHLYAAGFEPARAIRRFLPYSFTGALPAFPLLTTAYLHLRPAWRLLGKQFLVIARKPGDG